MNKFWLTALLACFVVSLMAQTVTPPSAGKKALLPAGAKWHTITPSLAQIDLPDGASKSSRHFLTDHFGALGLTQPEDLRQQRAITGLAQQQYQRYERYHAGYRVLGGQVTLQLSPGGAARRLLGHFPAPQQFIAPAAAPTLPTATLVAIAKNQLSATYPQIQQWSATDQGLVWVSPSSPSSPDLPYYLVHAFELSEPAGPQAEMVYLDPQSGKMIFRHQLHCSLHRELYKINSTRFNLLWEEGEAFPGALNDDGQEVIRATGEIYNLFYRTFGRKGYDGNDGPMLNIINASLRNCPNAFARGNSVSLCNGVVGDDIVGHEWTHNYLQSMNGLLFRYESGSIHEAYSDIFGEVVDLLNKRGTDDNHTMLRDSCNDNNQRWRIAEDAVAFDGYLRDMWNPACKTHPDHRSDVDYFCKPETERDGIHINAGVINKTFSLLTDGGILNGDTVRAIGMTKALHLFYHAADKYMTPVTDFPALAQLLRLSAQDLRGVDLPVLTLQDLPAMASGEIINVADSLQIERAISATRLMSATVCPPAPTLAQTPPGLCPSNSLPDLGRVFYEDWETGLGLWILEETPVQAESWQSKPWRITSVLPDGRTGKAIFAPNTDEGDCRLSFGNGTTSLTSPLIPLPRIDEKLTLSFRHYYSIQSDVDGGTLEISVNGAPFSPVPGSSFLYNAYDGELQRIGLNDNPLAGREAFSGADANSSTGSWGESQVDLLAAGARAGDIIRLRWMLGQNGCEGWLGWYLDDISISFCQAATLPITYLNLSAQGKKDHIALQWETRQESSNEGFWVERSEDGGLHFNELGFVAAGAGSYSFDDYSAVSGPTYFFRLRQRDIDGQQSYSPVVSASLTDSGASLKVYPNPVQEALTIESSSVLAEISLYDVSGRRVRRMQGEGQRAVLDLDALPAGIYWLRAGDLVRRVIKTW